MELANTQAIFDVTTTTNTRVETKMLDAALSGAEQNRKEKSGIDCWVHSIASNCADNCVSAT
jgi:hypothetical protein